MGIYGALSSAVTGLRAQAHALENISGNIANSQTTGYKRIETDFLDLIPDAPISRQVPGAVLAQSRGTNDIGGDIKTVSNETFIALNSNGFFVVEPKIGQSDGNPVFAGSNFYTRRGDFEIDKDGMLVNGAGYYLKGLPIDTRTGNISGSVPEVIKLSNSFLPAQQSNRINYQANLPQLPKTTAYDKAIFNSELMQPRSYSATGNTPARVGGTNQIVAVPTTATLNGSKPTAMVGTANANTVLANGGSLTLTVGGNAPVVFDFFEAPAVGAGVNNDIDITPPVTINSVLATIQGLVRAGGGPAANANVALNADGQVHIDLGTNTSASFTLAGDVPTLSGLGLAAGTTPATMNAAAATYFQPGQSIKLNINGTTSTYDFYNTATYSGSNQGVDVSGDIASALANLQASIRANGGPSAASATVSLDGSNRIQITLGDNHYASFQVVEGDASLGIPNLTNSTDPVRTVVTSVAANQNALFLSNSISGGAVTVYAENGAPANVQLRWAKVSSAQAGGTDTWNLFYMSDSLATGGAEMWKQVPTDFTFAPDGSLASPTDSSIVLSNLSINGVTVGDVEFRYDTNGLSQFADVNGTANVSTLNQNGYGAGEFVSVAINDNGRVTATYSNGERIDMAQVVTAEFNAINKLKRLDGGVFSTTSESGEAILDLSGSGVLGGALEASNTDISDEFTKLIVTQQAYAAGTRIVSTADEMLQEALNMIR
ncbi:MAG TPA: flagellar hook-basal body complex protein [Devosia sp.]|jgi:flagellar hook protein FlgE|uniref:flagellar hook-basal body complex protein n=1 Tax=Devosia sp. TaxID=1871048 RepID=UPI002F93828E